MAEEKRASYPSQDMDEFQRSDEKPASAETLERERPIEYEETGFRVGRVTRVPERPAAEEDSSRHSSPQTRGDAEDAQRETVEGTPQILSEE